MTSSPAVLGHDRVNVDRQLMLLVIKPALIGLWVRFLKGPTG